MLRLKLGNHIMYHKRRLSLSISALINIQKVFYLLLSEPSHRFLSLEGDLDDKVVPDMKFLARIDFSTTHQLQVP